MSFWESPHNMAVRAIVGRDSSRAARSDAVDLVDAVFDQLAEPDAEMLAAGPRELPGVSHDTLRAVWQAMLQAAIVP